jgi:integrase
LLYVTGLRISETLALEFDDFDGDTLLIRETKFKKCRRIPLHQTAAIGLQRYLDHRRHVATENEHLFISVRGQQLDRFSVNWAFRRLLQTIDLTIGSNGHRPRIHDLRHSVAILALAATHDIRKVSLWLGHTSTQTTEVYTRVDPAEKLEAINTLAPPKIKPGRFHPPDKLLDMLKGQSLWGAHSANPPDSAGPRSDNSP